MTNPIQDLLTIRDRIASLEQQEFALMEKIIKEAGHKSLGQKTYELHGAKVTIKTGENVTLDKAMLNTIWSDALPINRSYAYTLRQKDYDAMMKSGKPDIKRLLSTVVTTKPARPSVKVEG